MSRVLRFGSLILLMCSAAWANPAIESEVRAHGEKFASAWNKHDVKAMAELWAPDGDLINPYGRVANGRAEIEKLFKEEHAGVMRKSTYKNGRSTVRGLTADLAVSDWDVEITGMSAPDGKVLPVSKTHVTALLKKSGGNWWIVSARAFTFLNMPGPPKK